jgi:MFS family permease
LKVARILHRTSMSHTSADFHNLWLCNSTFARGHAGSACAPGRLRRPSDAMRVRQIPGAPALLLTVGIARLGVPALSLAMLLATRAASGAYATAGAVGAAYALAVATCQLGWGRRADRRGAARVIRGTALAHGPALGLFAVLAHAGAVAALIPAAAIAGACFPPVATVSRAAWRAVEDGDARRALFALDGVTTELTLIAGPLLATALATVAGAPATVALVGALVAAASLAAARSPLLPRGEERTDAAARAATHDAAPPAHAAEQPAHAAARRRHAAPPAHATHDAAPPAHAAARPARPRPRLPRALVALLAATVAMAAAIGAVTVGSVAFAAGAGLPAGLPLALMAGGGVAGALAWGARALPLGPRPQLLAGLVLYAGVVLAVTAAGGAAGLVLLVAAGALMAPCDALQAQLCGELAPRRRVAESFAYLNSANWAGFAAGTLLGGAAVDGAAAGGGFLVCAAAALVAAAIVARTGPGAPRAPA